MSTAMPSWELTTAAPGYSDCITTCEACLLACQTCMSAWRNGEAPASRLLDDAAVCVQTCEMALHAMATQAEMAPAACGAFARCCEALARECMLLPGAEPRRCARSCYRAARECHRIAQTGRRAGPPQRWGLVFGHGGVLR